ncbi:WD40-repeat-containing domain protein [Astrocystis sublimbata]|nr:WD40-repeat-containing domain protein [Astrocystis sublimbata]
MAAEVAPLQQLKLPTGPSVVTAEQKYWRTFKNQLVIPTPTEVPVTHITAPSAHAGAGLTSDNNDFFAVTAGPRVQIYSIRTRKLVKTISRFSDNARSGEIRRDGRIIVAGEDTGKIQVFDVKSRAILKTWDQHKQPVWTTKFSPTDLTTLMSASDDRTVRLWDLPSSESSSVFIGHSDYVRSGAFIPGTMSNLLVSGSYDNTVRLWDPRTPTSSSSVMVFKHHAPIEDVLPLASGTTVLASSGNQISVLDLVAAKPRHVITNHQKTVTSLSVASNGRRVVSGSLDGHIKIYETTGWNVVAGAKYPSPILAVQVISAGANDDDRHLAVGMQSGVLSLRTRLTGSEAAREREREKEMEALLAGNIDTHDKAKNKRKRHAAATKRMEMVGENVEVVIANDLSRPTREQPWQKDLRHGKFRSALDRVLDKQAKDHSPLIVLTVLVALRHRSALRDALEGRDEITVQPILRWVQLHIVDPRYVSICTDVVTHLLNLYAEFTDDSKELAGAFRSLSRRVNVEVERSQVAVLTSGMLDSLLAGVN